MPRSKRADTAPDTNTETMRQGLQRDAKGKIIPSTVVRFWELVAAKLLRDSPDERVLSKAVTEISVLSMVRETGLPKNVVYGMANGTLSELPLWIVEPLCAYLGATPADLLGPREQRAVNLVDAVMMYRAGGAKAAAPRRIKRQR